jgi:hypothetical protein
VTLSWKASSDAHEVSISGVGAVPRSGARQVDQRQTRVYVLRAVSYFGCSAQEEVRVDVSNDAPVILEFHANPAILGEEGQTTLSWSTTGAESVTLQPSGNPLPVSGQVEVRPGPVSRFTLRAESWYGIVAERHLSVAVIRRAKLDLSRKAHLDLSRMAKKMTPSAEANRRDRG